VRLHILISVFVLIFLGCSSHQEIEPPDNPLDPNNPVYESPTVDIISGPFEGEILDGTTTTIEWEGNVSATEYRYKFDTPDWSEWNAATTQTFDYLDEGNHSFELQARSINGDAQSGSALLDFEVDAVAGPSALVYPYRHIGSPGDTLVYQIMAEEVTDLFAVECHIEFDDEYLELIEVIEGDILAAWGGTPLVILEQATSSISASMVSVEGSNNYFSGSGSILSLRMKVKPTDNISSMVRVIELSQVLYLNTSQEISEIQIARPGWVLSDD
jgi:hypothetical protein